jgi:hypothetical protein
MIEVRQRLSLRISGIASGTVARESYRTAAKGLGRPAKTATSGLIVMLCGLSGLRWGRSSITVASELAADHGAAVVELATTCVYAGSALPMPVSWRPVYVAGSSVPS